MNRFFLAAKDPGEIPRQTNTSLFTSHVTSGIFIGVCLIGMVFVVLVFLQNRKNYSDRKDKKYDDETTQATMKKAARHDFASSSAICLILLALLVFLIISTGRTLLF